MTNVGLDISLNFCFIIISSIYLFYFILVKVYFIPSIYYNNPVVVVLHHSQSWLRKRSDSVYPNPIINN